MTTQVQEANAFIRESNRKFQEIRSEISKVIVGQSQLIDGLLIALLADGHVLLEGLPGLAKTLAVTTFAKVVDCTFKRIQFTPDLLPSDLVGTSIYHSETGEFSVKKGPLFANVVLADEINRAPAKVQSALLEVMGEKQITIADETFVSEKPFIVLATQNPVEQEGTYPLPEAQTDRFMMKIRVNYPNREEEKKILSRMACSENRPVAKEIIGRKDILEARKAANAIYVDEKIIGYILDIIFATRYPEGVAPNIVGLLEYGASPRASLALTAAAKARAFLDGRSFVTPHDIKSVGLPVLRHRLRLSYEAEAEEITTDDVIGRIFDTLLVP